MPHSTRIYFAERMLYLGWQELFLIFSVIATVTGAIRLCSSDPKSWRQGGIILLSIPVILYLLLVLQAVFGSF